MSFWSFASDSPWLTFFCLLVIVIGIDEVVKSIAKACGGKGRAGQVDGKLDVKVAPKASEKAH